MSTCWSKAVVREVQEVRSLWATLRYIRFGARPLPPDEQVPGSSAMTQEAAEVQAHLVDISLSMTATEAQHKLIQGEKICYKVVTGLGCGMSMAAERE